jgi:tubulin--tyrosine ligase-like protein 12
LVEDPREAMIIWSTVDLYNILRQQINIDFDK